MARKAQIPPITAGQARYILSKLIDEGTVSADDVRRHIAGMWEEMNFLERRVSELRGMAEPLRHPVRAARKVKAKLKSAAKRVMTAERKASQQLQGQYLGYISQIPKNAREKYQRIAKADGREQAIAAMRKALGR
jgi:hypothetical protein